MKKEKEKEKEKEKDIRNEECPSPKSIRLRASESGKSSGAVSAWLTNYPADPIDRDREPIAVGVGMTVQTLHNVRRAFFSELTALRDLRFL